MIHTIGDIILAANLGRDLHNLVLAYLLDYCTYANGANGIKYVKENIKYTTIHGIKGTPDAPVLVVSVCTKDEYVPYDYFVEEDPPEGYEGYGRCGRYETSYYRDHAYSEITIPMQLLLDPKDVRINKLTKLNQNWIAKKEEESRQAEIARLKAQLDKLENIA